MFKKDLEDARTNPSREQEVPSLCKRKQSYQFQVLPFSLNTGIYSPGAHCGMLPPLSKDIGNPISQ